MKLDKSQKNLLRQMIRSDGWDVIYIMLAQWGEENGLETITGQTEFETLRALHKMQGKIEGVKEFLELVEQADDMKEGR